MASHGTRAEGEAGGLCIPDKDKCFLPFHFYSVPLTNYLLSKPQQDRLHNVDGAQE